MQYFDGKKYFFPSPSESLCENLTPYWLYYGAICTIFVHILGFVFGVVRWLSGCLGEIPEGHWFSVLQLGFMVAIFNLLHFPILIWVINLRRTLGMRTHITAKISNFQKLSKITFDHIKISQQGILKGACVIFYKILLFPTIFLWSTCNLL